MYFTRFLTLLTFSLLLFPGKAKSFDLSELESLFDNIFGDVDGDEAIESKPVKQAMPSQPKHSPEKESPPQSRTISPEDERLKVLDNQIDSLLLPLGTLIRRIRFNHIILGGSLYERLKPEAEALTELESLVLQVGSLRPTLEEANLEEISSLLKKQSVQITKLSQELLSKTAISPRNSPQLENEFILGKHSASPPPRSTHIEKQLKVLTGKATQLSKALKSKITQHPSEEKTENLNPVSESNTEQAAPSRARWLEERFAPQSEYNPYYESQSPDYSSRYDDYIEGDEYNNDSGFSHQTNQGKSPEKPPAKEANTVYLPPPSKTSEKSLQETPEDLAENKKSFQVELAELDSLAQSPLHASPSYFKRTAKFFSLLMDEPELLASINNTLANPTDPERASHLLQGLVFLLNTPVQHIAQTNQGETIIVYALPESGGTLLGYSTQEGALPQEALLENDKKVRSLRKSIKSILEESQERSEEYKTIIETALKRHRQASRRLTQLQRNRIKRISNSAHQSLVHQNVDAARTHLKHLAELGKIIRYEEATHTTYGEHFYHITSQEKPHKLTRDLVIETLQKMSLLPGDESLSELINKARRSWREVILLDKEAAQEAPSDPVEPYQQSDA